MHLLLRLYFRAFNELFKRVCPDSLHCSGNSSCKQLTARSVFESSSARLLNLRSIYPSDCDKENEAEMLLWHLEKALGSIGLAQEVISFDHNVQASPLSASILIPNNGNHPTSWGLNASLVAALIMLNFIISNMLIIQKMWRRRIEQIHVDGMKVESWFLGE